MRLYNYNRLFQERDSTLIENKWSKFYGGDVFTPDFDENKSVYEAFREAALKYADRTALELCRMDQ